MNKYYNEPAITITMDDGNEKYEFNMYICLFEEILNQLKKNKVVDVGGRDDYFIGYTKDLANAGLMTSPQSTMYPYCNYFPLKDEEMLSALWEMYEQNKDSIVSQ